MTINEKTTYTATSLPGAPPRETSAEAEADEARGVELAAYLAVLPTLTEEQWSQVAAWFAAQDETWNEAWVEAWDEAEGASQDAGRGAALDEVWKRVIERDALQDAAWAACAIIVRDLITPAQFDTLTAPMRAARIDFDALATGSGGRGSWPPAQVCPAAFAHTMHIWELDDGQARYCPGVWTQSEER